MSSFVDSLENLEVVRSALNNGFVSAMGVAREEHEPRVDSIKTKARNFVTSEYEQAESLVRTMTTLFGGTEQNTDQLKDAFIDGFVSGMGKLALADLRLADQQGEATVQKGAEDDSNQVFEFMLSEYQGFNDRLAGKQVTKRTLSNNPFIKQNPQEFDRMSELYGHVFGDYEMREVFLRSSTNTESRIKKMESAYIDLIEQFPLATDYHLRVLALRFPDNTSQEADARFALADKLSVEFPNVAYRDVVDMAVRYDKPRKKLASLEEKGTKIRNTFPHMPVSYVQVIALRHPKQPVKFAQELEKKVVAIKSQYPDMPRDRIYTIGISWGLENMTEVAELLEIKVKEFASENPDRTLDSLYRSASTNPRKATELMKNNIKNHRTVETKYK